MKYLSFLACLVICLILITTDNVAAGTEKTDLYKVGINDIININVIGHSDLATSVVIAIDGTVAFPLLGTLYVKDKTLSEIEKEITRKLGDGYIKIPVVSVSLLTSSSKRLYILGETGGGREVQYEKDLTIIKALALSGGIPENALYGKLKLRRRQKNKGYINIMEADLHKGLLEDRIMEDMLLEPDDILIIEHSDSFYIQGQVKKIGEAVLEDDMTVSRALTIAGGIAEDGLYGKIKLRRKKEGSSSYVDVKESDIDDGDITDSEMEDMLLQPDDILKVERSESFFIEGEVTRTGQYTLEYGMTVGRAITVAGGIAEGGIYGKVKVRRKRENNHGYEDIKIDLEGIIDGNETGDMILQPDDIIIIDRNKTYIVYGEVNRIGEFPLQSDTTVFKAILEAGGFNKWGSESRIKVLRPSEDGKRYETIKVNIEDILDGDITADIVLQKGDIVIVSAGIF